MPEQSSPDAPHRAQPSVASPPLLDQSVREFLAALASKTPTPGGGSVAALAGALAASLAQMAMQYTVGKPQFAEHRPELVDCIDKLRKASGLLQELVDEDMAAYAALSPLLKLPEDQRQKNPDYAPTLMAAIRAPEAVGGVAIYILVLCDGLLNKVSPMLLSDLAIAAALAHATVQAAELNVLVNLRLLGDREQADHFRRTMNALTVKSDVTWGRVRQHAHQALK